MLKFGEYGVKIQNKKYECDSLILSGDAEPGKSRSLILKFGEHGVKIQNKDIADF